MRKLTKHSILGQRAVADCVGSLVGVEIAEGPVSGLVHCLVVKNMMAMGESSTLHVLPAESHVNTLLEQRAKCHGLSQCPVDCPRFHHLHTCLQNTLNTCTTTHVKMYDTVTLHDQFIYKFFHFLITSRFVGLSQFLYVYMFFYMLNNKSPIH